MQIGYDALHDSAAWIDLSERGKLRVTGEDAGRLLHAMCTNNVRETPPNCGLYAFFLNDKGRILADANIFNLGTEYFIDTEGTGAPVIHHHLDHYTIADDAETTDETNNWFTIGIEGPQSAAVVERLGLPVPAQPLSIIPLPWGYIARVALTGPDGFRVWANESKRTELFQQLLTYEIPQALEQAVEAVRLEHAIPLFGKDITERYLVQETQQMRAVSFTKGCYLGQEIVERIRSQGRVHRLLTGLRVAGNAPPPPGSKLVIGDAAAGEITTAAFSPRFGEVVALGYVRTEPLDKRAIMQVAGMPGSVEARVA